VGWRRALWEKRCYTKERFAGSERGGGAVIGGGIPSLIVHGEKAGVGEGQKKIEGTTSVAQ